MNNLIDVGRVFAWYHVTADLSVFDRLEIPGTDLVQVKTALWIVMNDDGIVNTNISSVKISCETASCLSILFPRTNRGIPCNEFLSSRSWSSLLAMDKLLLSAASTIYLQYWTLSLYGCKVIRLYCANDGLIMHTQLLRHHDSIAPTYYEIWADLQYPIALLWHQTLSVSSY